MSIIVVSLSCTTYHWGSFIALSIGLQRADLQAIVSGLQLSNSKKTFCPGGVFANIRYNQKARYVKPPPVRTPDEGTNMRRPFKNGYL